MADASIRQKGETYQVRIRMNGLQCEKSLGTRNEREAMDRLGEIRRTVRHIDEGLLTAPEGVDLFAFILSGGKLQATPQPFKRQPDQITLKTAWERYRDSFPPGSKESLRTESIHARHFFKVLKAKTPLESITFEEMQRYANARGKEKGLKGRSLSSETIKKELATFRLVWNHNMPLSQPCPVRSERGKPVKLPKTKAKEPFKTFDEVTAIIERGVSPEREGELWESVFLSVAEIRELLEHVKTVSAGDYRYPMFALAAYTGARRIEIMRAEIEHFRFDAGWLMLTEKKRQQHSHTFRNVPLRGVGGGQIRATLAARESRWPP